MSNVHRKGIAEARRQLFALVREAEAGRTIVITRYGRAVAALVPMEQGVRRNQRTLLDLAGSGRGLWASSGGCSIAELRDEWDKQ
jgi:prevent-host-death family protein